MLCACKLNPSDGRKANILTNLPPNVATRWLFFKGSTLEIKIKRPFNILPPAELLWLALYQTAPETASLGSFPNVAPRYLICGSDGDPLERAAAIWTALFCKTSPHAQHTQKQLELIFRLLAATRDCGPSRSFSQRWHYLSELVSISNCSDK